MVGDRLDPFNPRSRVLAGLDARRPGTGTRMRDIGGTCEDGGTTREGLVALALQAMQRLAARRMEGAGVLQAALLDRIVDLATAPDRDAAPAILDTLRRAHVPDPQIADLYLAEAARRFGEAWFEDRMSFSQVTIGVVRLQEVLHRLQIDCESDVALPDTAPAALIIVPPGEQHTLGALLLSLGLRRRGISVSLQFAPTMPEVSRLLAERPFDIAFVSVGTTERVETCVKLVKSLKRISRGSILVAVGGAVIDECRDSLASSGADLVTNDVDHVLARIPQERAQHGRDGG